MSEYVVQIENLRNYLGGHWVHDGVNLHVKKGEIYAVVGGSGAGKTTILRSILMLQKPTSGTIKVFDVNLLEASLEENTNIRRRWGMLFQQGALFSSLTVLENVMFPLLEFTRLKKSLAHDIAMMKITMTGLPPEAGNKLPGELSGGMRKRAALSRALALDPELLFLDEPTSGLDPKGAEAFDKLVRNLRDSLNLTILMVTHDLDSLWDVADTVGFLGDGLMIAEQNMSDLINNKNPLIQDYFSGPRGQLRLHAFQRKDTL